MFQSYLADSKPHPVGNVTALIPAFATTPGGQILFSTAGTNPKAVGRSELKQMLDSGECVAKGKGKKQTVRLAKSPRFVRGNTKVLREAETKTRDAIIGVIEKGGGRLITEVAAAVQQALGGSLKKCKSLPEVFAFALFRRVIDRLVEDGVCDRTFTPHEGVATEVLKKHEKPEKSKSKKKETAKKKNKNTKTPEPEESKVSSEEDKILGESLTGEDRQHYLRAMGIPQGNRTTLQCDLTHGSSTLADVVWASATDDVRRRFLAEQLGKEDVVSRIRETLVPATEEEK